MTARSDTLRSWRVGAALTTLALVAVTYGVWEWSTASGRARPIVLPPPDVTFAKLTEIVARPAFREHLWVTLSEVVIGFSSSSIAALVVAGACNHFPLLRRILTPYIATLQAVPKIVLLPLLYTWFGVGRVSTTAMVALVVFFPVYVNTLAGLSLAPSDGVSLLRILGATPRQQFLMLRLPTALPLIFTSLKTALNFALTAALAAEILGSRYGLGYLIANAGNFLRIAELYATIIATALVALLIYATLEVLDRKIIYWRERV